MVVRDLLRINAVFFNAVADLTIRFPLTNRPVHLLIHHLFLLLRHGKSSLNRTQAAALQANFLRGLVMRYRIAPVVAHFESSRIECYYVLNTGLQIEGYAHIVVFRLIVLADHLDYRLRQQCDRAVLLVRDAAEDADVGPLQRTVGKSEGAVGTCTQPQSAPSTVRIEV